MIEGVEFKELETHCDERGFFRELIRKSDPFFSEDFGQWSMSQMFQGVIKAWHIHQKQIDWWYVATGVLRVALYDTRDGSPTQGETMEFLMGDHQKPQIMRIPTGVAHGCKVLQGPSVLFYITSNEYNPDDELRIPYDDPEIGYDWLREAPIT